VLKVLNFDYKNLLTNHHQSIIHCDSLFHHKLLFVVFDQFVGYSLARGELTGIESVALLRTLRGNLHHH
jgi:hypothetical protein